MTKQPDTTWIDQLIAVGKDLGLDLPGQPPARARTRTSPTTQADPSPPPPHPEVVAAPATLVAVAQEVSRSELADLVDRLAGQLRDGSIVLQPGPYAVRLEVPDDVSIDVVARTSEHSEHAELAVDLTIRWSADHGSGFPPVFGAADGHLS